MISLNGTAVVALAFFMLSVPGAANSANESTITGRASIIDGDTIEIHGERIRFNGIDAAESAQLCLDGKGGDYRCGADSANALGDFLSRSAPTSCEFVERDRYGRFVGVCFRADGADVNQWMVENGHALDWQRYSNGAYASAQAAARSAGRGMWQGSFDLPWEWRRGARGASAPVAASVPSGDCLIKGNINSKGDRIFHSPGQRDYERTVIHEHKGQRWFCSEDEAIAAGWRPAKR